MAVKWKPSATAFCVLCCFLIILPNAFVTCVRIQAKRVKGANSKGKCRYNHIESKRDKKKRKNNSKTLTKSRASGIVCKLANGQNENES